MDADESGALSTEELSEGLATLGYQVRSMPRPSLPAAAVPRSSAAANAHDALTVI